jgi:oligosaccharide repeat unit polymerase
MNWISWLCFGICSGIVIYCFKRDVDILSPGKIFAFIWSLAIGLTELKFSAFQHIWSIDSWILLLTAILAFLVGTFMACVLNLKRKLIPVPVMRELLKQEKVHENRLFWLICLIVVIYSASYIANFLIIGWLPIEAAGRNMSRVDFNVTGLSFLTYLVPSIMFFIVLYFLKVQGKKNRKIFLSFVSLVVLISFLLFVSRFQIIIIFVVCGTLFYYATHYIKLRTAIMLFLSATAFFYWISSLRYSRFVITFL